MGQRILSKSWNERIAEALKESSDRSSVILVASWADELLRMRLESMFSKGNLKSRRDLYEGNGPFSTLSAKINAAFTAGWIESDVYHDLHKLRKIRNEFAHSIDIQSIYDEPTRDWVTTLRVPRRAYHDWGEVGFAATDDGVVIYSGERPPEAREPIHGQALLFRMAMQVLFAVLVWELKIPVDVDETGQGEIIDIPEHLKVRS